MSVSTCVVRDYIYKQDGSPDAGARVTATLSRWEVDLDEGYIGPAEVETVTNDEGYFELELFPQQDGSTESVYVVRIEGAERSLAVKAVVPASGQVWLRDVATLPAFPGKSDGQAAIEAAIEARGHAEAAAGSAEAAQGYADAAALSAGAAAQSASDAADSAAAARESEEAAEETLPHTGLTPPDDPQPGKDWIDSASGRRYTWFVDEDGQGQWVELFASEVISNTAITDAVDDALAVQLPPAVDAAVTEAVDAAVADKMDLIDAAVQDSGDNATRAEQEADRAEAARDAALLSRGVFPSTAAALSNGVRGVANLMGGSGGTDGTFDLAFSGGDGSGAAGVFVVAGGAVVSVQILAAGSGYTSAPTLDFSSSAGLTGASADAVIAPNVAEGEYFSVPDADDNTYLVLYQNLSGMADEVKRYPSDQAVDAIAEAVKQSLPGVPGINLFDKNSVLVGYALNSSGQVFAASGRNVSDYIAIKENTDYFSSYFTYVCWYDESKTFISRVVPSAPEKVTSPAGAVYARLDVSDLNIGRAIFEEGGARGAYVEYLPRPKDGSVLRESLADRAVNADKLDALSVHSFHFADAVFLNCHDGSLKSGVRYSLTDGITEIADPDIDATYWIPVKPGVQYTVNEMSRVFFYDERRRFLQIGTDKTFTVPAACRWVRFNLAKVVSYRFQMNEGAAVNTPVPQPHKFILPSLANKLTRKENADSYSRFLNLSDAWYAWLNGEKFPVAFIGDSTTEGNGTYPGPSRPLPASEHWGEDYVRENAYPAVLENIIRAATGSTVARCYNAGYSGTTSEFGAANIANILSGDYADTKMLGISYGINDRSRGVTEKAVAAAFRQSIEAIIVWCYEHGIQPFLLTTQPVVQAGDQTPTVDVTTSVRAESVCNRVKRELADKWGLELIDINKFGREFQTYSDFPLLSSQWNPPEGIYQVSGNTIHWANVGHKYEAELIFAHICPRVIWTTAGERLDFSTQQVVSGIDWSNITQVVPFNNGFKLQSKFTKEDDADVKLQEFWVFNASRGRLSLTAYAADAVESAYVKLNGVTTIVDTIEKHVGTMDLGLHRIEAWSGETTSVNWCGFTALPE